MKFPKTYSKLNINIKSEGYSLIPIRYEDRLDIMKWRNEQIGVLRQKELLTRQKQDLYFQNVISKTFDDENPKQLLFSILEGECLIGYGGLVHIDWNNRNAEISFLLDTSLNKTHYHKVFIAFLESIENIGEQLNLHKIYTYGYDIAEYRFQPIIDRKFELEAVLKKHIKIEDSLFDIKIYSKFI